MNKVLKDPLAVKKKSNGKWPWGYNAPTKDQAHSGYLSAGDDYGIGRRQPVGTKKVTGVASGPIPQKASCFSPDEIFDYEDQKG